MSLATVFTDTLQPWRTSVIQTFGEPYVPPDSSKICRIASASFPRPSAGNAPPGVLEVLHSPGHHEAAVTFHDPWTGTLLTGDTVLPGRLFAFNAAAVLATMERLVSFAATRPVTHVLGCHIEMTRRPGRDYPIGADYQPRERALELPPAHLTAIRDAAAAPVAAPGVRAHPDFVLYAQPGERDFGRLLRRGRAHKFLRKLAAR
ncbi:hypothetical protein [Streptomyces sp. CA-106110]|uniref:hypothetical protein n=1 Tax=Streptomyces sp. CA-106110 TaxID=3240044 RepID=UPI003D94A7CC